MAAEFIGSYGNDAANLLLSCGEDVLDASVGYTGEIAGLVDNLEGNAKIIAEYTLKNGNEFAVAASKSNCIDTFCDIAKKYGDDVTKVLTYGDDAVNFVNSIKDANIAIDVIKNNNMQGFSNIPESDTSTVCTFTKDVKTNNVYITGSSNYQYNKSITVPEGYFDEQVPNDINNYYYKKYNQLLEEDFINNMDVEQSVKDELHKLRQAVENTESSAFAENKKCVFKDKKNIANGKGSYQKDWSVTNCGEVWGAREAILNGAKFEDLVFKSINRSLGVLREMCENCKHTFGVKEW